MTDYLDWVTCFTDDKAPWSVVWNECVEGCIGDRILGLLLIVDHRLVFEPEKGGDLNNYCLPMW